MALTEYEMRVLRELEAEFHRPSRGRTGGSFGRWLWAVPVLLAVAVACVLAIVAGAVVAAPVLAISGAVVSATVLVTGRRSLGGRG